MRAQIAITRSGVTQASNGKTVPDGGAMVRRTNGEFFISLHRKVSETALIQLMRTLRALDADFEMNLEAAGHMTRHLTRQEVCLRLALRGLNIIERASEPLFMSNLELFDDSRQPPACRQGRANSAAGSQHGKYRKSGLGRSEQVDAAVFSGPSRGTGLAPGVAGYRCAD